MIGACVGMDHEPYRDTEEEQPVLGHTYGLGRLLYCMGFLLSQTGGSSKVFCYFRNCGLVLRPS